jgi:hypothetical protein
VEAPLLQACSSNHLGLLLLLGVVELLLGVQEQHLGDFWKAVQGMVPPPVDSAMVRTLKQQLQALPVEHILMDLFQRHSPSSMSRRSTGTSDAGAALPLYLCPLCLSACLMMMTKPKQHRQVPLLSATASEFSGSAEFGCCSVQLSGYAQRNECKQRWMTH